MAEVRGQTEERRRKREVGRQNEKDRQKRAESLEQRLKHFALCPMPYGSIGRCA